MSPFSIRTPDQRVRVFISSTIGELAAERLAARKAIENLRLIPVFFEMGARPHPPRELYRAYLEQSHIFLGIYWNNYGWVAPGMEISGLEDEYRLSAGKPRLIYVKKTDLERDANLQKLLNEIELSGTACYQKFSTIEELQELIEGDLALLLSEHFQKYTEEESVHIQKRTPLPVNQSPLIGRDEDTKAIIALLQTPGITTVTVTGPGGTGKSRISTHIANELSKHYRDGVYFVPLAQVNDAQSFISSLAENIGIYDSGKQDLKETVIQFLFDKQALLLLDNFEHIITAAPYVAEIMAHCKDLRILITSRSPLHIRGEQVYQLSPLAAPTQADLVQLNLLMDYPAIELFIRRSQEINPSIRFDRENLMAVARICNKLNGIPLAIELAAARTKLLSPIALLQRMGNLLDTLTKGAQDLPERHRTLRATIDWSYDLLDDACKTIFRRLSIFRSGWTMEGADEICNWESYDMLEVMEQLMDLALIQSHPRQFDASFTMFEAVREFAVELLEEKDESEKLQALYLRYYIRFLEEADPYLWSQQREVWLTRIDLEYWNIRDAFYYAVREQNHEAVWRIVQELGFYWTTYGKITEAVQWIHDGKVTASEESLDIRKNIDPKVQAAALRSVGMIHFFSSSFVQSVVDLTESVRLFLSLGEEAEAARSMAYLGISGISTGDFKTASNFYTALELSKKYKDVYGIVIASAFLSEVLSSTGKIQEARNLADESIRLAKEKDDHLLCALSLGQRGNIEIIESNYDAAEQFYRESLSYEKKARLGSMTGWFQIGLGLCMLMKENYEDAKRILSIGIQSGKSTGDKAIVLSGLIAFAWFALRKKDVLRAARLFGAAEALIKLSGYTMWNETRKMNDWVIRDLNAEKDQENIVKAKHEGNELSIEAAIEYALNSSS